DRDAGRADGQDDQVEHPPDRRGVAAVLLDLLDLLRGRLALVGDLLPRGHWRVGRRLGGRLLGHRRHPAFRSAMRTMLVSSIARVIGPTPPGFGETHPATSQTSSATSPAILPSTWETPTSSTAAPGLTMSPVMMP